MSSTRFIALSPTTFPPYDTCSSSVVLKEKANALIPQGKEIKTD